MERSFENVVLEVDAVDGYPKRKETAEVYSSYFYKSYSSNHTRKSQLSRCASTIISCYSVDYKNRYLVNSYKCLFGLNILEYTVPNVYVHYVGSLFTKNCHMGDVTSGS